MAKSKNPQDEAVLKAVFGAGLDEIVAAGIKIRVGTKPHDGLVVNIPSWGICSQCHSVCSLWEVMPTGVCETCATSTEP